MRIRTITLFSCIVIALATGFASPPPGQPLEDRNVTWWAQFPDLVGTDFEFEQRGSQNLAFVASMGVGFKVFDITSPTEPKLLGLYASPGYQNDIQVQGNLAILADDQPPYPGDPHHPVCATCSVFQGLELVDVSNPAAPVKLSELFIDGGAHNSTLVGSTVYVSNPSRRAMDIVDVSDPRHPRVLKRVAEEAGCATSPYPCQVVAPGETNWRPHDITARPLPGRRDRLYVAAIEATFILDVDNAHNARVLAKIPDGYRASYANLQISHQADPSPDGRFLVVSDERGGGISEFPCPGGGLHVYDLTDIEHPRQLGVYFAPDTLPHGNCTVHVFRFLPDRDVLVTSWYTAGSWVVDVSGPPGPGELTNGLKPDQETTWGRTLGFAVMPGADTWATKSLGLTPDGRLFMYTDDMVRGMDVFEYTGPLPPPIEPAAGRS